MSESVRVNLGAGSAADQPLSIDPDVTPGSVGGESEEVKGMDALHSSER